MADSTLSTEEQHQRKMLVVEETLGVDRISSLPDCLIHRILSLLPTTKDAITTSKLSKRWKPLWTSTPTLVFISIRSLVADDLITSDFVLSVNKTLSQCRSSKLNKFQLHMTYDARLEYQINNWICYAISRNVEVLDLTLDTLKDKCVLDEQVFINSSFTHLKLSECVFNPIGEISWNKLRSLSVSKVGLDEDLMRNILAGSPELETLELDYCYGFRRLDITSESVKNLVFSGYFGDAVEINAPNIMSLKIRGALILQKLLLLDVWSLVEAELNYKMPEHEGGKEGEEEMLKGFIQSLYHVNKLQVGMNCAKVLSRLVAKGFHFPSDMEFPDNTSVRMEDGEYLSDSDSTSAGSDDNEYLSDTSSPLSDVGSVQSEDSSSSLMGNSD